MKSAFAAIAAAFFAVTAATVEAAEVPVVVELYTSQGCSSCPDADAMLRELAQRDDVIALALHVDYWDYIGWKDQFADPAFAKRQRLYARKGGRRMVYTPQMIVGGKAHLEGANPMKLVESLERMRRFDAPEVTLSRKGDRLTVRVPKTDLEGPVAVQLVRFDPGRTVDIRRGENRGKTLHYSNIVTSWETLRTWNGRSQLSLTADVPGKDRIAVILQYPGPGLVVSAAALR